MSNKGVHMYVLWLIHIIFPNLSAELWPLIDFRIMFMLNILWKYWWIWSDLVVTSIFLCRNMCNNKNKHSGGYHVMLAMLLLILFSRKIFKVLTFDQKCLKSTPNVLKYFPETKTSESCPKICKDPKFKFWIISCKFPIQNYFLA